MQPLDVVDEGPRELDTREPRVSGAIDVHPAADVRLLARHHRVRHVRAVQVRIVDQGHVQRIVRRNLDLQQGRVEAAHGLMRKGVLG